MNRSSISVQLQHDYPHLKIFLDTRSRMIVADKHKMSLLNSSASLETMNIFTRSGKSFYQAIVQLLYTHYDIIPEEGSYADKLIIRKEDLDQYRIQKLAREWGIGFLEDNSDIIALDVDDGIERDLMLEDNSEEDFDFPEKEESVDDILNNYAILEELREAGEDEEPDNSGSSISEENSNFEKDLPEEQKDGNRSIKGIIKRFFKRK